MAAFLDVCRFNPTLGGTTDWTYSSAVTGYNSPALAGVVNGRAYKYRAESSDLSQWEIGEGAYNTGTGVLARTTVLYNSSGTGTATGQTGAGSKISFSAAPQVAVVAVKEDLLSIEEANSFTGTQQSQARANIGSALNDLSNVSFAVTASSGALTIALKTAAGNDPTAAAPVVLNFRDASRVVGALTSLTITAANSVVVPSTSTLGVTSSTAFRIWITGWNDGGVLRLGVFNASDATHIYPLNEGYPGISLQVVAAGNSAGQHYTSGAALTNKGFRILGYVDWLSTGLTAGTWTTTNLASVQTFGPGIQKPGDSVQTVAFSTSTNTSTTSSTFQTTNLSAAIVPTNAANLIRFSAAGVIESTTSGNAAIIQMHRGSTAVGGQAWASTAAGGDAFFSAGLEYLDFPNSNASTTYAIKLKSSNNTNTVNFPAGVPATLLLSEIMG